MALVNYIIRRRIRSRNKRIEQLKKLKRILFLSLGLNGCAYLLTRGGTDLINVDYIECGIEMGLRYLNNNQLRTIIHDLYWHKRKGKVIYITTTVVCHLAHRYGQTFLALPFTIGNFGFTNLYQTARKIVVTILLGRVGPCYVVGGSVGLAWAFVLALSGLPIAFTDLDSIPTSPIYETGSAENIEPRIPSSPEVIVVNNRNKIIMTNPV